jgi:D-alanyl-D-alanine carboxypeptidase-like protein
MLPSEVVPSALEAVRYALDTGREAAAVALAMRRGNRNENLLTDLVFHARHPERGGRALGRDEHALVREWLAIRDRIVRAVVGGSVPVPAGVPTPAPSGFIPTPVESPGGGRIADKREPQPADLEFVPGVNRPIVLHRLAARALRELVRAARAFGVPAPLLLPTSGHRSVARQTELWQGALKKYGSPEVARRWVAPPGSSAHHSGRAIDFYLGGRNSSANVETLRTLPAYKWLVANAESFGFYPYAAEPWHWEYNPRARPELEEEAWRTKKDRAKTPKKAIREHVDARLAFIPKRDGFAEKLGIAAGSGGHVHHAIELQLLKGFPGVFTPVELNDAKNMRAAEPATHNGPLRVWWNDRYRRLDRRLEKLVKQGLDPKSEKYKEYVRKRVKTWVRQADKRFKLKPIKP